MSEYEGRFHPLIETTMRVMSWNLWWRFGPWEERQPAISETLRRVDADVVTLQEVWDDGETNQAAELAIELGYHHVYDARLEIEGLRFGNAVLSRWPIVATETLAYTDDPAVREDRVAIRADIDGPRGGFQVFSTHLNWRANHSGPRQEQVRQLMQFVADSRPRTYPAVVGGDFNAIPTSDEIRIMTGRAEVPTNVVFTDAWEVGGDGGPGFTWSNANPYAAAELEPQGRIDYILAGFPRDHGAGHVTSCRVAANEPVDGVWPSDHFGVVAELRY